MQEGQGTKRKYIRHDREERVFYWVSAAFLFSLFVMPQYFGIPTPVFDFTLWRMMMVVIVFLLMSDATHKNVFADFMLHSRLTLILLPYLLVLLYTMVLRADINAFLNPFIELFSLYLLSYIIHDSLGVERTLKWLIRFSYLLAVQGILEYVMGRSLFSYLETIKGIYTGPFIRSGNYRIMGPCVHSLGYGLLLIAMIPLACFDYGKNEIDLFRRPVLILLLAANVFLTGSRSTLGVFCIEAFAIFLFSSKASRKKGIWILLFLTVAMGGFLAVFYHTGLARYILLQLASMMDSVLGTEYSVLFGGDKNALGSSSNYREQLIYIFTLDWLNPVLGLGRKRGFSSEVNGSFLRSIDNFYIAEFVRYAYPGLASYVLFLASYAVSLFKNMVYEKQKIDTVLFVGVICYLINLLWVDSLQTLKYLYIHFAIFICLQWEEKRPDKSGQNKSKYRKQRGMRWI